MKTLFDETVLTPSDAARLLGVTNTTIRNWLKNQRLRAYKVGGRIWIAETAVKDLIKPTTGRSKENS